MNIDALRIGYSTSEDMPNALAATGWQSVVAHYHSMKGEVMLTSIGNIHGHKLPAPGSLGYIVGGSERYTGKPLYWHGQKRLVIVESFALCDNPSYRGRFYSYGIHCFTAQFLDNGERRVFACQYFVPQEGG